MKNKKIILHIVLILAIIIVVSFLSVKIAKHGVGINFMNT